MKMIKYQRPLNSCLMCASYVPLAAPCKRHDGHLIYGYCFSDNDAAEKGYAVYIPEGICVRYKPKTQTL